MKEIRIYEDSNTRDRRKKDISDNTYIIIVFVKYNEGRIQTDTLNIGYRCQSF